MRHVRPALFVGLVLAALSLAPAGHAAGPLQTSVYVQEGEVPEDDAGATLFFRRIRQSGATAIRLNILWRAVAPSERASEFQPKDPADPAYNWSSSDRLILLAVANKLEPLVGVLGAPSWAGGKKVNARAFGEFASAAASRYSGSFEGVPRVRYWLAWNEPNLSRYLAPQVAKKQLVGAARYRSMVNAFATAVHAVRRDNIVVAGLVAPFTFGSDPGPLKFMRAVLCMSSGSRPKPTCSARTQFDIWSVHPYTSGGPRHHAVSPNDASLGDLRETRAILDAAIRAHHVISSRRVQFWVTEFSWDSKGPDPKGVPLKLEAQWVSEALFRAWQAGVTMFSWFQLRDQAQPSPFQSGLFFGNWTAKPALTAFRFPFVAFKQRKGVSVWGRTPAGKPASVAVERSTGRAWKRVATLRTTSAGVFSRVLPLRLSASSSLRARIAGSKSIPFPLKPPRDLFVTPFGS